MNTRIRLGALAVFLTLTGCGPLLPEKSVPPGGVESYEKVTLGGIPQSIQIRGQRRDRPVLLFLHGGPGIPEMPVSRIYGGLENDFIVVQWDQRGTGLSYQPDIPMDEMKMKNFVADALELTAMLKKRFNQRKIYLVGFSFGSGVGILAAKERPEDFHAYVGISQFLNLQESEEILDEEGRERAREAEDGQALARLEELGRPPYRDYEKEGEVNRITRDLVKENTPNRMGTAKYLALVPGAKAYRLRDLRGAIQGRRFVFKATEQELYHRDVTPQVGRMEVPCYFLNGRWDTVLSSTLTERFSRRLISPMGKEQIWFERSGHAPHLEEPEKFVEVMRGIKRRRDNF